VSDPRADYESRFRRAGLPLLIEGRTAATEMTTTFQDRAGYLQLVGGGVTR
jgi:hypothetical protein